MKALINFIILSLLFTEFVQGQEKAVCKVSYQFKHLRDTVTRYVHTEDMTLLIGKNMSVYSSQTKYIQDSIRTKAYADAEQNGGTVNLGVVQPVTQESFFVSIPGKQIITQTTFRRNIYLIHDPLEEIRWKILSETKKIKGYTCQKATTYFKGRYYEVWFTVELPLSYGPWKLQGLPGVILEATDNKNEVQFFCTAVIKNPNQLIQIPTKGIKSTKADFNKMIAAYSDGAGTGSISGGGSDVRVEGLSLSGSSSSSRGRRGSGINNPIEKGN
ncbi:MAG: GLPGLI family protein [Chitinophagaceae bacterium]|jgi:GLPGLI family protein|nr:GLPGLI family protein [Chitinophagaceae bacterium]